MGEEPYFFHVTPILLTFKMGVSIYILRLWLPGEGDEAWKIHS